MRISSLLLGASLLAVAAPAAAQTAPTPATADAEAPTTTLREAMVQAYNTNPELSGERANLRATDEGVPLARASGLPTVSTSSSYSESLYDSGATAVSPPRTASVGIDASLPIYSGGSVANSVRAAERRVEAGRANLRGAESDLFVSVVTVYLDVMRYEAIVRLNRQNVEALKVNLQATRDRFEVGDLTRTDVAQSEARLALAESQLRGAEAQLIAARESYIRVVGTPPGALAAPPPLPDLPDSPDAAVRIALDENPSLAAARKAREASRFDTDVARASRLPKVSVNLGTDYYNRLGSLGNQASALGYTNDGVAASAGLSLSLPLFQGGRPAAQIRQAQARESQAIEQVTYIERAVVSQVRSAYANYQSTLRVIEASRVAVQANQLSLEGVRAENSVGTRTILDILNAEQELLNAQVNYVTAERDAYVAGFTLLAAMGRAEAEDLGLGGGALYDPMANYNNVRGRWSDWGTGNTPEPVATSTAQTPAQTPDVSNTLDPLLQHPVDTTYPDSSGD
ncbi:TolC family outer membrane protein [Sphingosinithalassobacter portus]|uniref:TolC family outer membrane protein n=1 Tax=Stakelama portus TaxID=2676234 RepID=UPI000D6E6F7D|nr:TolC family outer membrane protein [Sphingosinithalassobacter portus]